jgi:hypothetical protein
VDEEAGSMAVALNTAESEGEFVAFLGVNEG